MQAKHFANNACPISITQVCMPNAVILLESNDYQLIQNSVYFNGYQLVTDILREVKGKNANLSTFDLRNREETHTQITPNMCFALFQSPFSLGSP